MTPRVATCAVISNDAKFVKALRSSPPFESGSFQVAAEIQRPYPDITDADLDELRELDPDLVILDLESNLPVGLKFAEFLADAGIGDVLLASAPPQSPELLMDVMHAGVSDFIPKPLSSDAVEKALKSARRKLGKPDETAEEERSPAEMFVYFGAKGGSGCTTLCTNTAIETHRMSRKKTLLVDLDLELGDTALQLGEEPRFNMVDLIRNFHRVDSDLLASYIEHHESGVDLLSAPYQPTEFEPVSRDRATQILAFLRGQYDYVFVDAPHTLNPAINPATIAAIDAANHLMVVTTGDLPGIRNLTRCLPLLSELGGHRSDEWIRVVLNRYDPRGLISLKQVQETSGSPVFATVRNDYKTVSNAINEGTPAVMSGSSAFAEDIRGLAGKLTGMETESKRGWLVGLARSLRIGGARADSLGPEVRTSE